MRTALLTVLFWLAASTALAQSVVVVVPETAVEPADLERARAGAIEVLAERGIRLVRVPDGEACEEVECAAALATQAGADATVLVELEAAEDGSSQVRARFVPAVGAPRDAARPITDGGVAAAASFALDAVLDELTAAHESIQLGFVRVRTEPANVAVELDGEPVGRTPLRRAAAPGEHVVRLLPEEGEALERRVTVSPGVEAAVTVDLAREDPDDATPDAPTGPRRTEPSPFNWLIGGGLALGGIIALISPLQTLAQEGECIDAIESVGCVEKVRFGAQSGVLLGIGLAALVAAVVVDATAPIRVEVSASDTHAAVRVGGRF